MTVIIIIFILHRHNPLTMGKGITFGVGLPFIFTSWFGMEYRSIHHPFVPSRLDYRCNQCSLNLMVSLSFSYPFFVFFFIAIYIVLWWLRRGGRQWSGALWNMPWQIGIWKQGAVQFAIQSTYECLFIRFSGSPQYNQRLAKIYNVLDMLSLSFCLPGLSRADARVLRGGRKWYANQELLLQLLRIMLSGA